jgi:hypothetical protein
MILAENIQAVCPILNNLLETTDVDWLEPVK